MGDVSTGVLLVTFGTFSSRAASLTFDSYVYSV